MTELSPKQLVAAYNRGMITGHELTFRLIEAAVDCPPEIILPLVPEELRDDVRQRGLRPPETPEAVPRIIASGCFTETFDRNTWQREQQVAYYDGAWRWHRFLTAQPT